MPREEVPRLLNGVEVREDDAVGSGAFRLLEEDETLEGELIEEDDL